MGQLVSGGKNNQSWGRRGPALIGASVILLLLSAAPAVAKTFKVKNNNDSGNGSLRKTLTKTNDGDTIFVPGRVYTLTSGELTVKDAITIKGAGARKTIISAAKNSQVFNVNAGLSKVTFAKLKITKGYSPDDDGAGIRSESSLTLKNVAITKNRVEPSSINYGGGVHTVEDLTIRNSLVSQNTAYNGGGLSVEGIAKVIDTTLANNTAGDPESNGNSGAIETDDGIFIDSTIVGNRCFNGTGCGGAFHGSNNTFKGTIIGRNFSFQTNGQPAGSPGNPGAFNSCSEAGVSSGHNLTDDPTCMLEELSDINTSTFNLGKLKNNGGQTDTMMPAKSSPAYNGGAKTCTAKDQRGVKRPQGKRCDIGAVERN